MIWSAREVLWPSLKETAVFEGMTGGNLELTTESPVGITGNVSFGESAPSTEKLLRIYCDDEPVATCFVGASSPVVKTTYRFTAEGKPTSTIDRSGTASLYGLLKAAADRLIPSPRSYASGESCIQTAKSLLENCSLTVEASDNGATLASDTTFSAGTSYIDIALYLLGCAGYPQPYTDELGKVHIEPADDTVQKVFEEGDTATFEADVTETTTAVEGINRVMIYCQSASEAWTASARDISNGTPIRYVDYFEEINEIEGDTQAERGEFLQEKAKALLAEKGTVTETREIACEYAPLKAGDAITLTYAGSTWTGNIETYSFTFSADGDAKITAKREKTPSQWLAVTTELLWSE